MTRLELPFPVLLRFTNVKGTGRVPTSSCMAYGREAGALIARQRPRKLKGQVSVYIRLVAPDRRARAADNLGKCILDTLKANGLIEDDSNRFVRKLSLEWADEGPGCVVLIQQAGQVVA